MHVLMNRNAGYLRKKRTHPFTVVMILTGAYTLQLKKLYMDSPLKLYDDISVTLVT